MRCSPQAGPAQRAALFPGFFAESSAFTDDLYVAHEAYLAAAGAQLLEAAPVLKVRTRGVRGGVSRSIPGPRLRSRTKREFRPTATVVT